MSTYAIKADKFFLPAGPQLGGYLMVEDGVFGAWQAGEPAFEVQDYFGTRIGPGMGGTPNPGFLYHPPTRKPFLLPPPRPAVAFWVLSLFPGVQPPPRRPQHIFFPPPGLAFPGGSFSFCSPGGGGRRTSRSRDGSHFFWS